MNNKIETMNFDDVPPNIGFYIAGFIDADGSFFVSFSPEYSSKEKRKKEKEEGQIASWDVRPTFLVSQKEEHIVNILKKYLKCGNIYSYPKKIKSYQVEDPNLLNTHIIPFFKKFGFLSTKKKRDFSAFCQVLHIFENLPLTIEDIKQILKLRMNIPAIVKKRHYNDEFIISSLSESLHKNFLKQSSETNMPNSKNNKTIINEMIESDLGGDTETQTIFPNDSYITGFCDGDGSFNVSFVKRNDYRLGWKINPSFSVSQRDEKLMNLFQISKKI